MSIRKASMIIDMPILGIKQGAQMGKICNLSVDAKTKLVSHYYIQNGPGCFNIYVINATDVMGIGDDYVVVSTLESATQFFEAPDARHLADNGFYLAGARAITCEGSVLTTVRDYTFNYKTGVIDTLILSDERILPGSCIASLINNQVFINLEEKAEGEETRESQFEKEQREFLLGRKLDVDLTDQEGRTLLKCGTVVSARDVYTAKEAGLLVELIMSV